MTRPDHTAVPPAGVIAAAEKLRQVYAALQQFKRDWQRVPYFADRVNKATRVAISEALSPIVNLDAVGGPLDQIPAEGAAPTAAQAAGRSVAYRCPSGCGCLWRDNNDGTMSLLDGRQKSCPVCERMPLRELEPMAIADHLFIDCRDDGVWLVCVEKIHRSEDEARSSCRQWKAAYGNASYAPHATLAASRDAESATSGATSAAKVELEGQEDPFPEHDDAHLGLAYRQMVAAFRRGLKVDFPTGWISVPPGAKAPKPE
jgi:hypothetical protein